MALSKLKKDLLSINDIIYFDSTQFLREKSSNLVRIKEVIDEAEVLLMDNVALSKEDNYFLHGTLGNLYRIYGDSKAAIPYLTLYLENAIVDRDDIKETIALIRLGEALKYDGQPEEALEQFDQALAKCELAGEQSYMDFALQQKGKCLLELNRIEEAITCFQEALDIRKRKEAPTLVQSTELALALAQELLA